MEEQKEGLKKHRSSKYQLEKRVHEVVRLLNSGKTYNEVVKHCLTKLKWELKERQIKNIIAKAQKIIDELPADELSKLKHRFEKHYNKFVQEGQDVKAVSTLKEIAKLERKVSKKHSIKVDAVNNADTFDAYDAIFDVLQEEPDFRHMYFRAMRDVNYGFVPIGKELTKEQVEFVKFVQELLNKIPEEKFMKELEKRELPEIQNFVLDLIRNIKNTIV